MKVGLSRSALGLVSAGFALLPGFALPFIVSARWDSSNSDDLFLAMSIAIMIYGIFSPVIEVSTIAEITLTKSNLVEGLGTYLVRISATTLVGGSLFGVPLLLTYQTGARNPTEFALAAWLFIASGIVGSIGAVFSGLLMAAGRLFLPLSSQSTKTLLALVGIFLFGIHTPVEIAIIFCVGEITRIFLLARSSKNLFKLRGKTSLHVRGFSLQSISSVISQASPISDRYFLGQSQIGSVTTYELADKLYFMGIQVLNYAYITPNYPQWAKLAASEDTSERDVKRLFLRSSAYASIIAITLSGCLLAIKYSLLLPNSWADAIIWAMVLIPTIPLSVLNTIGSRLLAVKRKQALLVKLSLITVFVNLLLDIALFSMFGAIGIVAATALTRLVTASIYFVSVDRVFRNRYLA